MSAAPVTAAGQGYTLTISRLTIDKLGVKLYDKVSAVVAELIANGYDADAEHVTGELPLGTELAAKDQKTKQPVDKGYEIVVRDDGHGMSPDEARAFYLKVGRDRRAYPDQGAKSWKKERPVMDPKGIGKLAPSASVGATIDGHDVCRLDVKPSTEPVFVTNDKGDADLYVRLNNSTRLLNTADALKYVRQHLR